MLNRLVKHPLTRHKHLDGLTHALYRAIVASKTSFTAGLIFVKLNI